ncbi:hypothetical protein AALO_G00196240, partial [Alosa alosa]
MCKSIFFQCAEKDQSPLKVSGVGMSSSRQSAGQNDLLVNHRSIVNSVTRVDFLFAEIAQENIQEKKIHEILSNGREFQKVNVTAKAVKLCEEGDGVTRQKVVMKKATYIIADATASVPLTIWGNNLINVDCWYSFSNVSVRRNLGSTVLTTTAETLISTTVEQATTVVFKEDSSEIIRGEIASAEAKVVHVCPKRHEITSVNVDSPITRCEMCKTFWKTKYVT